jgi:hypothetical protein
LASTDAAANNVAVMKRSVALNLSPKAIGV